MTSLFDHEEQLEKINVHQLPLDTFNKVIDRKLSLYDKKTIWSFKEHLSKHNLYKAPFNLFVKQLIEFCIVDTSAHVSQKIETIVGKSSNKLHESNRYLRETAETLLKENKCISRIHEKGYKNRVLTKGQEESNTLISKIRVGVEHIFDFMTDYTKGLTNRCIRTRHNNLQIGLISLYASLFRYEHLVGIYRVGRVCVQKQQEWAEIRFLRRGGEPHFRVDMLAACRLYMVNCSNEK